jgi:hypothetical protein
MREGRPRYRLVFVYIVASEVSAVQLVRPTNITLAESEPALFLTEEDTQPYSQVLDRYSSASFVRNCFFPSRSNPELPQKGDLGTCAVVGASPNSQESRAGSAIDRHAAVFRAGICDNTTLRQYRRDIGARTTFCVSFTNEQDLARGARLVLPLTTWDFLRNLPEPAEQNCRQRLLVMHPRFLASASDRLVSPRRGSSLDAEEPKQPGYYDPDCLARSSRDTARSCQRILAFSSGFYAVLLAMELCTSVDVYGFDTDERAEAPYGHLHNDPASVGAALRVGDHSHPFLLERRLLKSWDERGRLHLHPATKLPATLGPRPYQEQGSSG